MFPVGFAPDHSFHKWNSTTLIITVLFLTKELAKIPAKKSDGSTKDFFTFTHFDQYIIFMFNMWPIWDPLFRIKFLFFKKAAIKKWTFKSYNFLLSFVKTKSNPIFFWIKPIVQRATCKLENSIQKKFDNRFYLCSSLAQMVFDRARHCDHDKNSSFLYFSFFWGGQDLPDRLVPWLGRLRRVPH